MKSEAIAKAGTRKERKAISSKTGAMTIPKNVMPQAASGVEKNSSMGRVFGGVVKYVTICIMMPSNRPRLTSLGACTRAVYQFQRMPSRKGRFQTAGKMKAAIRRVKV